MSLNFVLVTAAVNPSTFTQIHTDPNMNSDALDLEGIA